MSQASLQPTPSAAKAGRTAAALILLLVLAAGLRMAVMAVQWEHLARDPDAYRLIAENLRQHGTFSTSPAGTPIRPTAFRPPLYPTFLAAFAWQGRVTSHSVASLHIVLGLLSILTTWVLARRWGLGAWSYLAAVMVACDPILLNQSSEVMTETLATFLTIAGLLALTHFSNVLNWKSSLLAGMAVGLATLCRPTFLIWMVFILLWVVLYWWRRWTGAKMAILMLAGFLIVLAPWVIRNQQVMGRTIVATTHGGYTLLLGNNPFFYQHLRTSSWGSVWDARQLAPLLQRTASQPDHPENRSADAIQEHPEIVADRRLYELARETIRQDLPTFLYASMVKVCRLWNPLPHQLGDDESRRRSVGRHSVALWYVTVFAITLFGIGWLGRRTVAPPWVWGLLCVLALSAVHTIYWSNMRMRAPAMPVVYLAFALGCRRIYEQSKLRKLFSRNSL